VMMKIISIFNVSAIIATRNMKPLIKYKLLFALQLDK